MRNNRDLFVRVQNGDKDARETLIMENIGLVKSVVGRFHTIGIDRDDFFQIGMIGLIKAIDYFDLNYDVKFSTYAVPMIAGELRRYIRDNDPIKISRSIKDNRLKLNRVKEKLYNDTGCEPSIYELAEQVALSVEDVILALNSSQEIESLHQSVFQGDGSSIRLIDKISVNQNENEKMINRVMIHSLLENLEKDERDLIFMRFYMEQTQSQIANKLGISQVQVSRLEKRILKKMKVLIH